VIRYRRRRWPALLAVVVAIAAVGALLRHGATPRGVALPATPPPASATEATPVPTPAPPPVAVATSRAPGPAPAGRPAQGHAAAVDLHFQRGLAMLHARRFDYAVLAFHQVLRLAPRLPEAHVNMGFALLGEHKPAAARDFFATAIELRPAQANAYYGLAVAAEAASDIPAALGAMRTFIHLSPPEDPFVRKARAALWEWQSAAVGAPQAGEPAPVEGGADVPRP
jgi:tetratricopeptide (TPR) repeat protein